MPDPSILLEMRHVTKRYGGTLALSDVSFAARAGEIHAVMGENGAGKSTLIRVSSGVTDPSDGELLYRGEPVRFTSPLQAVRQGIVCVFQELSLVPDLTVAENLSIVDGPRRFGLANRRAEIERARALLDSVGCGDIHPLELVRDLIVFTDKRLLFVHWSAIVAMSWSPSITSPFSATMMTLSASPM